MKKPFIFLPLFALQMIGHSSAASMTSKPATDIVPVQLRTEYRTDPIGIDVKQPRLSWELISRNRHARGQRQSAFRILAAGSREALDRERGDLWDSGKVASRETLSIRYEGNPLRSGQRVYWKVRVWDQRGRVSSYSEPALWEMGLLRRDDWRAKWIASPRPLPSTDAAFYEEQPSPLFRKALTVKGKVRKARVYVTGLGYYELRLNGKKVGDHVLDPGWTDYSQRVFYSTYDVTEQLTPGEHALGIMLGNGWYNPLPLRLFGRFNPRDALTVGKPRCILRLHIEYEDGSSESVVTDESWRTGDGPIVKNSVYLGEVYDARREQPGWDAAGFEDGDWMPVEIATEPPGKLEAQYLPPIKVSRTLKPQAITEPQPGVFIFDLGQNLAGWATLRARGPAGTRIRLRYGELLHPDGTLNVMTSVTGQIKGGNGGPGAPRVAWQEDAFVLKGAGEETFTPRFTFHGFRYIEVTGYPGKPTLDDLDGHLLHSAVESSGEFSCSNGMFNRIQEMVRWTQLSNMFGVQSDCPHREKLGYGGDIVATSEMAIMNFDMSSFYVKAVRDLHDAVRPNGGFTETAPYVGIADEGLGEGSGPVGWGTAHPALIRDLYRYYGNRALMEEQYEAAKRWVKLLESMAVGHILDNGISDHESLVPKPVALTGTAFYHFNARLVAQMARALGKTEDDRYFSDLAQKIRRAFNRRFLGPEGRYDTGTQTAQAFAFYMGMVPSVETDPALQTLIRNIMEERDGHLSTGIFGTKYLLDVLTERGRADVAYAVVNQRTFPGWGHMLENGATTLWEHWAFSDNTFSHNHPMFGSVSEWFFKALAGIRPDPAAVGFDKIVIQPQVVGDLEWVKGRYESVRGDIISEWKREGNTLTLDVSIPVNTQATMHIPADDPSRVSESGIPAGRATGVRFLRMQRGAAVYRVGSGRYRFEVTR